MGPRLFVVNAQAGTLDVLDAADPTAIAKLFSLSSAGVANSVAIRPDGLGVIAFEAPVKTDPGHLVFFDASAADPAAAILGEVTVGALPDMVTISEDGRYAVAANEGEPADDYSVDPEGSIAVVTLPEDVSAPAQDAVRTADFHAYENGALPDGVRVFGPTPHGDDLPVSRNLEPEYLTVAGGTAYATLQENNAIAVVDLASATVTAIHPLGAKDLSLPQNALDPSDKDGTVALRTFDGLYGLYQPDGIDSYTAGGPTYLVTANEGDAREWGDYAEAVRVADLAEDGYGPVCADNPLASQTGKKDLGRLNVTTEDGFDADAGCYRSLYAFGGRSFSIWSTDGALVWDSGSSFEEVTAAAAPEFFNSNHTESNLEGRSDDKGPEPESVVVGEVDGRTYAFVGFERVGGIAVYDITSPTDAGFVTYVNNRDFSQSVDDGGDLAAAGDLGPEGLTFIPASASPTGVPLLAVGNEVSGTTTLFAIDDLTTTDITVLTINDFHGRIEQNLGGSPASAGIASIATAVSAFEATNPNTLLVSAGDNVGASTFTSFIQKDNPTIDTLKAAGLDVSAVGNHEFDRGFDDLLGRIGPRFGDDDFVLGANVYLKGTTTTALPEYALREVDGVRIAFVGVVTPDTATMVSPDGIADIEFGDMTAAVNRVTRQLEAEDAADVVIALVHDGLATEDCGDLASADTAFTTLVREADPAVDAIVSAHTHQLYACDAAVGDTAATRPVVQASSYGNALGRLALSVDPDTHELVSISGSTVPLVADGAAVWADDPEVAATVADAVTVAEEEGSVAVGRISGDILRGGTPAGADRGVESAMGNLVADMYLWATSGADYSGEPADLALMNPGGLRADLLFGADGTVTYRDVANVQPFANTIVTVRLTGAQLKAVLEEQWQPDGASRPKLQLGVSDGFAYTYDPEAARGEHIVSMTLDGAPVAEGDVVTVATNSFLAAGGDNFATLAAGTDRTDTGQIDLQASIAYFAAHDVVDPAPLGRAVVGSSVDPELPSTGENWATIDVGTGEVVQGGNLAVTVSGLEPGQQIAATLHSDPIVVTGIPAADAAGTVSFTIAIPADFEPGTHTLVVASAGLDPISVAVTVTAAADSAGTGSLPSTGGTFPIGFVTVLALGAVAAGILTLRRPTAA